LFFCLQNGKIIGCCKSGNRQAEIVKQSCLLDFYKNEK